MFSLCSVRWTTEIGRWAVRLLPLSDLAGADASQSAGAGGPGQAGAASVAGAPTAGLLALVLNALCEMEVGDDLCRLLIDHFPR